MQAFSQQVSHAVHLFLRCEAVVLGNELSYVDRLAKVVNVPGCSTSVVLPRVRPAMEMCEKNSVLLERLNDIWEQGGLSRLAPGTATGGSDAANVSVAGIPAVDGLGVIGGKIHTIEEYAYISSLAHQAKRIALAAYYL